jgi:hypothetical protein
MQKHELVHRARPWASHPEATLTRGVQKVE